jgi:hypothetical protein
MEGIVAAVFTRGRYPLVRSHTPVANEELVFDFSTCEGTVKEVVLALVAVEKVYRLIPDPRAGVESRVAVDAKVNEFLTQHFVQYNNYFSHRADGVPAVGYVTFTHVKEDGQYDDLTGLVIRRK